MSVLAPVNSIQSNLKQELEQALGIVPSFVRTAPPEQMEMFWGVLRDFQMSDKTALDGKTKELIGLGVASQIPCHYCVLFHTEAARLNGATDREIQEAVFMAGVTRMGSTLLNGAALDQATFDREMQQIVAHIKKNAAKSPAPSVARR